MLYTTDQRFKLTIGDAAYIEGRRDYLDGCPRECNPYAEEGTKAQADGWADGWADAKVDLSESWT